MMYDNQSIKPYNSIKIMLKKKEKVVTEDRSSSLSVSFSRSGTFTRAHNQSIARVYRCMTRA